MSYPCSAWPFPLGPSLLSVFSLCLLLMASPVSARTVESGTSLDAKGVDRPASTPVLPRITEESLLNRGVTWARGGDGETGTGAAGGVAIGIEHNLTNQATTNAVGGNAGDGGNGSNASAGGDGGGGGAGITVGGNVANSNDLTAGGGMGGDGGHGGSSTSSFHAGGTGGAGGHGISVAGNLSNSGTISATGGHAGDGGRGGSDDANNYGGDGGAGGHGITVTGNFVNSGEIAATGGDGGDGTRFSGVYAASGSGGIGGAGLHVGGGLTNNNVMRLSGGRGGETDFSVGGAGGAGLHVAGGLTNNSVIRAKGGPGGDGGSGGIGGAGLHVDTGSLVNYGDIMAESGESGSEITKGIGGAGVRVDNGAAFENHGRLTLYTQNPSPDAAAVWASGTDGSGKSSSMVFHGDSLLELAGQGFIRVDHGAVASIREGARLRSLDAATFVPGRGTAYTVIDQTAADGTANPGMLDSTNLFSTPSVTLNYGHDTSGDTYTLTVTREHNPSEFAESGNAKRFVSALQDGLYGQNLTPDLFPLARLMGDLDHQATTSGVKNTANKMARTMTPQAFASNAPKVVLLSQKAVRQPFSRNLKAVSSVTILPAYEGRLEKPTARPLADSGGAVAARPAAPGVQAPAPGAAGRSGALNMPTSGGGAMTRPDGSSVATWAEGFYHTGTLDADGGQYEDTDIWFTGVSAGVAKDFGPFVAGVAGHYVYGDMDADSYDADFHGVGVTLGLGRAFVLRDDIGLWTEVHGGYTHYKFDQERKDYYRNTLSSEPDIDVWTVGGLMNADFLVMENLVITPSLGLDYTRLNMDDYKESGFWGLKVDPEDYDSLQGAVGLAVTWSAPENWGAGLLSATLRGEYNYEFADTEAEMNSRMRSYEKVSFITKGQDTSPHSGTVGTGVYWQPLQAFGMGVDYDLHLGDEYVGHQINAKLKLEF